MTDVRACLQSCVTPQRRTTILVTWAAENGTWLGTLAGPRGCQTARRAIAQSVLTIRRSRSPVHAPTHYLDTLHIAVYNGRMPRHQDRVPKSDLLQGTLDLLILHVASLGPVHGYAIAQRLQQISKDALQVQQGSLYPALHRLEKRKLLRADWGTAESGREAKFYTVTPAGRQQLTHERDDWARVSQAITLILRTVE